MWLPQPPFVEKPRAVHNAASLAYLGDVIYEVHAFIQSLLLLFLLSLSYLEENLGSRMVFGRNKGLSLCATFCSQTGILSNQSVCLLGAVGRLVSRLLTLSSWFCCAWQTNESRQKQSMYCVISLCYTLFPFEGFKEHLFLFSVNRVEMSVTLSLFSHLSWKVLTELRETWGRSMFGATF